MFELGISILTNQYGEVTEAFEHCSGVPGFNQWRMESADIYIYINQPYWGYTKGQWNIPNERSESVFCVSEYGG